MKAAEECYSCLARLVRQAAELATDDPDLRERVVGEGLGLLDREFSTCKTSIAVATPLHRLVRAMTANADPYDRVKKGELELAAQILAGAIDGPATDDLRSCLVFAVRGNNIDFFKEPDEVRSGMMGPVDLAIDHTAGLFEKLATASTILFLADNAGEVPFDLPLVSALGDHAPVTYVVKESPVQDDVTLSDLESHGLLASLPGVMTTGTDTPGVDMEMASPEFRSAFEAADLVLAKGMGYWETLTELPAAGKVLHLLKAKCRPVADSVGVPLESYVALLR